MRFALILLASAAMSLAARAQAPFHAYDTYEDLIETGKVHNLVVDFGTERLVVRVPRTYAATVDKEAQSVTFREDTGSIAITMGVTTNSPAVMPADNALRQMALAIDPNESFLEFGSCATGYKPARFVDSIHAVDPYHLIRTRHAYVTCPDGLVEFIYSAKNDAFDSGRVVFNLFVNSFRVEKLVLSPEKPSR
jgi:hypothetical protein